MGLIHRNLLFIKAPVFFIVHISYIHRCKTSWRGLKQKSSNKLESAVSKCNSSKAGFSVILIPSFSYVHCTVVTAWLSVFPMFMCFCCLKSVKRYSWCLFCRVIIVPWTLQFTEILLYTVLYSISIHFAGCWWIHSSIFWWRGPLWKWGTRTWQINLSTSDASHRRAIWENWVARESSGVSWTYPGECVRRFKLWTSKTNIARSCVNTVLLLLSRYSTLYKL